MTETEKFYHLQTLICLEEGGIENAMASKKDSKHGGVSNT